MKHHRLLMLTLALSALIACLGAQQPRPEKAVFADAGEWPQTSPGAVQLKNFKPFRAVYQRAYVSSATGEPRTDRVIIHAEEVGWDGNAAILISLIDSGDAQWADAVARNMFMIVDRRDLHLFFESGPIPGKAKDYYFIRPAEGMGTMVMTADGSIEKREMPGGLQGFGPGPWVLASMDLQQGMKVHLGPFIDPPGSVLSLGRQGIVKGETTFTDLSGRNHQAMLLETPGNPTSSRMGQVVVSSAPPYFLASFSRDLDSGEESQGTRLLSFEDFE